VAPREGIVSWPYLANRPLLHPRLDLVLQPVTPGTALSLGFVRLWEIEAPASPVECRSGDGKLLAHLLFRYEAH